MTDNNSSINNDNSHLHSTSSSGDLSGITSIPPLLSDTELWAQQPTPPPPQQPQQQQRHLQFGSSSSSSSSPVSLLSQRDLLQAARQAFYEMNQVAMEGTAPSPQVQQFHQQQHRAGGFAQAMELLEGDMLRRQHVQATCEARLVEIYQTLRSINNNHNNNNIIVTMERNYINGSPEVWRYAKDLRENELRLFQTVSQNFATARDRCEEAVQNMQDQSIYGPIKEQYLRLHQMPLFAYGDALERLQGVQNDLMDEIVAIELIMFCGGPHRAAAAAAASTTTPSRQAGESSRTSPSFLTDASVSDHSELLQQHLSPPHRSHMKDRSSEMSPLRKAVGTISFHDDDDDDNDNDNNDNEAPQPPPITDDEAYPSQELKPKPASKGITTASTPWKERGDANEGGDQRTTTTTTTPKPASKSSSSGGGEWKTVASKPPPTTAVSSKGATSTSSLAPLSKKGKEGQQGKMTPSKSQQQQQQQSQIRRFGPWDASTSSSESG
jgi:hypothetical protein